MALVTPRVASGQSQASSGQIAGYALDGAGSALPGVRVTVFCASTGLQREALTDQRGLFAIHQLPPGTYELSELKAFPSLKVTGLQVTVGSTRTVRLDMQQLLTASETVTVTADLSVEVASPAAGTTFDTPFLEKLPINGRRFQDLVVLTPAAQVEVNRGQISLSGQRGINTNITIDGTDYNQPFFGRIRGGSRSNLRRPSPRRRFVSSG
jgi:hypothetical protein